MEPAFAEHMASSEGNPRAYGWGDFASMKAALAEGLAGGEWLLPQGFSGADLLIGGNLAWFTVGARRLRRHPRPRRLRRAHPGAPRLRPRRRARGGGVRHGRGAGERRA